MEKITDFNKLSKGDRVLVVWKFNSHDKVPDGKMLCIANGKSTKMDGMPCKVCYSNSFSVGDVVILSNELLTPTKGFRILIANKLTESEFNIECI